MDEKEYKIEISPAILELLGPSLYTNVYYVLAELIANAYDADAKNVYIIELPDAIIVEDDGGGMSYNEGVKKFLDVAKETRTTEADSVTPKGRLKMGRKGIGKLAALAVSENVKVMTIHGEDKSGFILTRHVGEDKRLEPISEDEIELMKVESGNGTSVWMTNPQYKLNKGVDVVKRNLLKMFPIVNADFQIHLCRGNKVDTMDAFDMNIVKELATLTTLGSFEKLTSGFDEDTLKLDNRLVEKRPQKVIPIEIIDKNGNLCKRNMVIEGWMGAYRSTRNRKAEMEEFPDNFVSIFSHGKMGEFNIIPRIGQNRLYEVYVVGQLYVDIFEDTDLPDMALSNRQGYKSDDIRYEEFIKFAQRLLLDTTNLRMLYANIINKDKNIKKLKKKMEKERDFRANVDEFIVNVSDSVATSLYDVSKGEHPPPQSGIGSMKPAIKDVIRDAMNANSSAFGLKPVIEEAKKKIMISQTIKDKDLADVVCGMLTFNGVPIDDILYTNSDHEEARIPEGVSVYDYLREFFVESYSNKKMYVIFVTSEDMSKSWGALAEVGANWITQMDHKIFNIHPFKPQHPLDVEPEWHTSERPGGVLQMTGLEADKFCIKIEKICDDIGYLHKSREENMANLSKLVLVK